MIQTEIRESICDKIVQLDSKIMFVGIIDDEGKILEENQNGKLNTILSIQELDILFMEIALGMRMEKEHNEHFGEEFFSISYGSKIIPIIFPLRKEIVCVFVSEGTNALKTALSISSVLSKT